MNFEIFVINSSSSTLGLRCRQHQGREWRRGGSGAGGDRQAGDGPAGRHPEDESAQVRQGGGHGRADLSQ